MDGVRICYIGINVNFASIVNECKMQIKYVGGSMKQRTWKALLAIALVLVLTLSLVPLGAAAPGAASAAPDTTDPQTAPEAELRAQTEDVNQTAPAPARRPGVTQRRRKIIHRQQKPPALAGGFWFFRCAVETSRVIRAAGLSFHAVSVVGLFALHDPGDRGEPVPRAALCGIVLTLRALAALCHRRGIHVVSAPFSCCIWGP